MSRIPWKRNTRYLVVVFVLLMCGYIAISNLWPENTQLDYHIDGSLVIDSGLCKRPQLKMWPDDIAAIYNELVTIDCKSNEENWASIRKGKFYISDQAVLKHGRIECKYQEISRLEGDMVIREISGNKPIQSGDDIPHDIISVKCAAEDGNVFTRIILGVKPKPQKMPAKVSKKGLGLNVIMFGFDSVSRLNWKRSLKESYDFFVDVLGGVVLEGYNIVGDGTPQALLPILTGSNEEELPEARRGFKNARSVDDHPWIWKDFQKRGYVTQWGEDGAAFGTFTYRMLGFYDQPVDHYMRPFYLAENRYQGNCFGSVPSHQMQLDYLKEFIDVYGHERKKFSFLFHSDYSHDSSRLLQNADLDLLKQLKWMNETGVLNDSLVILMSDHGARFTNLRLTEQGKYEERLPFFALRLPSTKTFQKKFPDVHKQLLENSKILTTPYDIHETMMDVLDYQPESTWRKRKIMTRPYPRGMSLFRKMPKDRTCEDASIEPHWCTCMRWLHEATDQPVVKEAAAAVVNVINELTQEHRGSCAELKLLSIQSASVVRSRAELLSFKKSADKHGRVADFSDNTKSNEELHQITIVTTPNSAKYEATVTYDLRTLKMFVNPKEVSRLNAYGLQPKCVAKDHPHLRAFCFCSRR